MLRAVHNGSLTCTLPGARGRLAGVLLGLALVLGACKGAPRAPIDRMASPPEGTGAASSATPAWADAPLSWEKLDAVERWLRIHGEESDFWRLEAELQLADGQTTLARSDGARGTAAPETVAARLRRAEEGYRRVLADREALRPQRERAERGLERVAGAPKAAATEATAGVLPRTLWNAAAAVPRRLTPSGGQWTRITVHHSAEATPPELDGSLNDSALAVRSIQKAHMNLAKPYGDIGYHFLVDPEGRVFQGRDLRWQGAHASGANNKGNVGICLLGNFETEHPTPQALAALTRLVDELRRTYAIRSTKLHAHKEFKNTLCPGRHLAAWLSRYNRQMASGPLAGVGAGSYGAR